MKYARIENGLVKEIVEQETLPGQDWVEGEGAGILSIYHNNQFYAHQPIGTRLVTRLAFISRFTDAEAIAIDLASIGSTINAASLRRYLNKINAATFIDLDRVDTRAGVLFLEQAGLLAAGRALIILDTPILIHEQYKPQI